MVKMVTFAGMILLVSAIFIIVGFMLDDFDSYYIDSGISDAQKLNSTYRTGFDETDSLNSTVSPIKEAFDDIGDEDAGWWEITLGSLEALPIAIISLPGVFFSILAIGISQLTTFSLNLNIPSALALVGVVGILIYGLFKMVETFRRYDS